jgi:hypothetical protein
MADTLYEYIVSDDEGEFGIAHIDAESRQAAVDEYVEKHLDDQDPSYVDGYQIGVVLASDVTYFDLKPSITAIKQ